MGHVICLAGIDRVKHVDLVLELTASEAIADGDGVLGLAALRNYAKLNRNSTLSRLEAAPPEFWSLVFSPASSTAAITPAKVLELATVDETKQK
jgi:hypothetical protein